MVPDAGNGEEPLMMVPEAGNMEKRAADAEVRGRGRRPLRACGPRPYDLHSRWWSKRVALHAGPIVESLWMLACLLLLFVVFATRF